MTELKKIRLKEHDNFYHSPFYKSLSNEQKEKIEKQKDKKEHLFEKNQYSKKDNEENENQEITFFNGSILNAYYIGVDWLIEDNLALVVSPKIDDLDFLQMFIDCFKHKDKEVSKKINQIYDIELNQKSIRLDSPDFKITPLIIIHFIKVLKNLVQRGLKKNYIRIEENLSSKIKGKIVFSQHLKKNIVFGRNDRVYCNYQDYSIDCLENQILKKTLLFCESYLNQNLKEKQTENLKKLNKTILFCKSFFSNVSDIKEIKTLKQFKINKLYRDYTEALQLAQMILRRFSYNIQESHQKQSKIPPFWIDMALLFEVYVFSKLKDKYKENILYQEGSRINRPDFLKVSNEEKIIIDAKYKDFYKDLFSEKDKMTYDNIIKDIRQLSGYARDKGVLRKLGVDENKVIPCLIIYPNQDNNKGIENFESEKLLENKKEEIEQFTKFYKIGVKLPSLKETEKKSV